jgi:predicted dehydrogenase
MGDEPVEFTPCDPYVGELTNFIEAIRNDTKPLVDGEEGLANVGLLEASARLLTARE